MITRKQYEVQTICEHADEWQYVMETDNFDEALIEADYINSIHFAARIIGWFYGHDGWDYEVAQEF